MVDNKNYFRQVPRLLTLLFTIGVMIFSAASTQATVGKINLLTNPGAETSNLSGWRMSSSGEGNWINGNPSKGAIPEPRSGNWLFFPGKTAADELYQDVNISKYKSGTLTLTGWMRDYTDGHGDVSSLRLEIRDSSGKILSSKKSAEVTKTTTWTKKSISLTIPSGAVTARVVLVAKRNSGSDCDSYFDDLSLTYEGNGSSGSTSDQGTKTKHPIGYSFKDSYGRVFKVINDKTMKVSLVKVPNAFETMYVAETAKAPDGSVYKITSVGSKAAANCTNLKKVWFSKNLTRIGKEAFKGCKNLSKVYFFNKNLDTKYVAISGFYNINKSATIYVHSSKVKAVKNFFKKDSKTKSFQVKSVPDSLKEYIG